MKDTEFEQKKREILKLGQKAYEAEKALSFYVQGVIGEYELKNDPARFKEITDLLPTGRFRDDMLSLYGEIKKSLGLYAA